MTDTGGSLLIAQKRFKYRLILEGLLVGVITGFIIGGFRLLLTQADSLRGVAVALLSSSFLYVILAIVILIILAIFISLLLHFEGDISGSGIPQVELELKGKKDQNPLRVIAAKITGCALATLGGLSIGREGPSVQVGAMVGKGVSKLFKRVLTEERFLITCGAGAGLSSAFGAPLAGSIFVLEELHKNFSVEILLSTMAASAASHFVVANIVGLNPVFSISIKYSLPLKFYWALLILGLVLGLFGVLYNKLVNFSQNLFEKIPSATLRLISVFGCALALALILPIALGSGGSLPPSIANGDFTLKFLLLLLGVKFVFSIFSFASGTPGGIFLPLLVLGALLGGIVGQALNVGVGMSLEYLPSFVVIGMVGLFASIVRAPITGVILITEMTGNYKTLLALVIVALISSLVADALGAEPIYEQLVHRKSPDASGDDFRRVIVDVEVVLGSFAIGMKLAEITLPKGCLVVSIERDSKDIIPGGSTILRQGDRLKVLCLKEDADKVLNSI